LQKAITYSCILIANDNVMFKIEKKVNKAILTIYGYVGGYYMDFRAVVTALDAIKREGYKHLDFHFHTYGGDVFDGNLIYLFLAMWEYEMDIYIDGVAASMGAIIATAGKKPPIIAENGFMMIHSPTGSVHGNKKQLIQGAKLLGSMEKNFTRKLADMTGKDEAFVSKWFDGVDYWFDADEAISLGLAREKFDPKSKITLTKEELNTLGAKGVYDRFTDLTQNSNHKSIMDKEKVIKKFNLQGVTAQSTEEEIENAIQAKIDAPRAEAEAEAINQLVGAAISEKKITEAQRAHYTDIGKAIGKDKLKATFEQMKAYEPITGSLKGGASGAAGGGDDNWKWDDFQAKAPEVLSEMPKKDPERFKNLYKEKYGKLPD